MFYSQLLLSKKGGLGVVWMAAHCHKRLKKNQVHQTNISSSVDKILDCEVPVVAYRILAFLLLGIVKIYSKKVEYLFQDCYEVLNKINGFRMKKRKQAGIGVSRTHYHSITLPTRFELDAFDLEQSEHQGLVCGEVRSDELLMIEDGCQKDGDTHGLICKAIVPFSEASSTACTPLRNVFSPQRMNKDLIVCPSGNMSIALAGGASFCLEDRLDPMELGETEEDQIHNEQYVDDTTNSFEDLADKMESDSVLNLTNKISNPAPSLEIIRGSHFSSQDHLDSMALDESEIVQTDDRPSTDNVRTNSLRSIQDIEFGSVATPPPQGSDLVPHCGVLHQSDFTLENLLTLKEQGLDEPSDRVCEGTEGEVDQFRTQTSIQENEANFFTESSDKAQLMNSKKVKPSEVNTPENYKYQSTIEVPTSIVTPNSKLPDADISVPEVANIQTPATKECAKILKKRKTMFDRTTILSNKVLKKWVEEDPSDLKRERRKVPRTHLHAWRTSKVGHARQNFLDPVFSGMSMDLSRLTHERTCRAALKSMKLCPGQHEVRSPDDAQLVYKKIPDIGSPVAQMSPEQTPVAPGTPVTIHSNSLRSHEIQTIADSEILELNTSPENIEKQTSSNGLELDWVFQEETSWSKSDGCSARTRMTESYLRRKFLDKKRKDEEEVLNMSQLLQGKTKNDSVRLFYEILVLKTRDCVDVEQANAYEEIVLRQPAVQP